MKFFRSFYFYPFLAVIFFLFYLGSGLYKRYQGNITGFLCIGRQIPYTQAWTDSTIIGDHAGYDSQYYYYIALNPFGRAEDYQCDGLQVVNHYRYQRLLYPLLAHVLALGQKPLIPYAMLTVSLLAIFGGTLMIAKFCEAFQLSRAYSLFYAFSLVHLITLLRTLAEPLYGALIVSGLYFYWVKKQNLWSAVFFALAVLTKEMALAMVGGVVLFEWIYRRQFKASLWFILPVAAFLGMRIYLQSLFGDYSLLTLAAVKNSHQFYFMQGLIDRLRLDWSLGHINEIIILANIFLAMLLLLYFYLRRALTPASPFAWLGLFSIVLVHLASSDVPAMIDLWGYGRHTLELFTLLLLIFIVEKSKAALIPVVVGAVMFFVMMGIL